MSGRPLATPLLIKKTNSRTSDLLSLLSPPSCPSLRNTFVFATEILVRDLLLECIGGEYVQKLTVKNVSTKLKKLKYRLPSTRFFSLLYPLSINLSPGTTQEFEVFFRPTRSEPYEDTIYFKLEEGQDSGGFHVPVRAFISTLQCTVPTGIDMGLCPINVTSPKTFLISNTGEVPAPFEWKVPPPFKLAPERGTVNVGESIETVLTIHPTSAQVFVANAVCKVGEGVNATKPFPRLQMKLSAVAKYPYIVASETR